MVLTPEGLRFRGRLWPCTIGRGGVRADKREGDGATPAGVHRIVGLLYRPDRIARPADWAEPIGPSDLWSDDVDDEAYNLMVRAPYAGSHEMLRRPDPLYDLVILTDWNWPRAERGRGSAIFLHRWRRPGFPTAGCVAFRRDHLHRIAELIHPGTRLIVPQALDGRRATGGAVRRGD
ncbi:L,D-transpeptidase family protein [Citreimonas salinaria]|uniref:L,D-transpeptidase catalytic domain n=1 Tax=Citreimonas salinaria TaxID=321339 RepID=A0A1H3JGD8_9RHOB|nr:L,D-transpeptidase family protein [Citreimonas salinaria]SDY38996.1 L,D-transpeptidase catalytic domain [Citreimonas salinaria]